MLLTTCCSECGGVQSEVLPSFSGPKARKSEQNERKAQNLPATQPLRLPQQVAFRRKTRASSIHQEDIIYNPNVKSLQSCLTLCDPMDAGVCEAPLSMGFFRKEFWSGLPFTMLTSFQKSEARIAPASCQPLCQEGRAGSVKPCGPRGAVGPTGESSQQKVPAEPGFMF